MQTNNFNKLKFVFNSSLFKFLTFGLYVLLFLGLTASFLGCKSVKNGEWAEDFVADENYSDFIKQADDYLIKKSFSGSVLISKGRDIIFSKGYGLSDKKNSSSQKNTIHTTYEIGSITKQMTAASIVQLAESKKLSYDDKISKFLPDYIYGDKITVGMLLTMRSGLYDHINMAYDFFPSDVAAELDRAAIARDNDFINDDFVLEFLNKAPFMTAPDSTHFYCNTDYYILGKIIEKVSGMSFADYLQYNIFDKCGMWDSNTDFEKTTSRGYDYKGRYFSILSGLGLGCGDVNSTVIDLFKWNYAFAHGKVVPKRVLKKMKNYGSYNNGVYVHDNSFLHGGATNVFNSFNQFYFDDDISIIVLANAPMSECPASIIAEQIRKMFFDAENE